MKYTREVVIDLPRDRVIELFDNADNLPKWQEGLQSFEHVSGEPGQPGAKSVLVYDYRGRHMEMTETVTRRDLPDEFSGVYETEGVWNGMNNRFIEEGPNHTRWVAESEFRFRNLKMRLMSIFMRPMFGHQTMKMLHDFKNFAENEGRGE